MFKLKINTKVKPGVKEHQKLNQNCLSLHVSAYARTLNFEEKISKTSFYLENNSKKYEKLEKI